MSKVVVLGGSGAVGKVSVKTLAKHNEFSEVVIADYQLDKAEAHICENFSLSLLFKKMSVNNL